MILALMCHTTRGFVVTRWYARRPREEADGARKRQRSWQRECVLIPRASSDTPNPEPLTQDPQAVFMMPTVNGSAQLLQS